MSQLTAMPPPDASGASSAPTEQPRVAPELFRAAVDSLNRTRVRDEVRVEPMRPPQRLAPWSYAVSADIRDANGDEVATGRLVLLHDPDGEPAWGGVLRLVAYASADVDPDMARDPLLPNVGWSWLIDSLAERGAEHTASGGTVTQTTSTRFGDLAGPGTTTTLELRGSWTPRTGDLEPHLRAFADLLANAVGLPPEGVTALTRGR